VSGTGLKRLVIQSWGESLAEHGFATAPPKRGASVGFERVLRGYSNHIAVDTSRMVKGFRLVLYAPKWPATGFYSHQIPGCPIWWAYNDQDSLRRQLAQAKDVLINQGLPWLDTYTPGNVPSQWSGLAGRYLAPLLAEKGFVLTQSGLWSLPDVQEYHGPDGMSFRLDVRVPGRLQLIYVKNQLPTGPFDERKGRLIEYRDLATMEEAFALLGDEVARLCPEV
jgi:hypothetical protein